MKSRIKSAVLAVLAGLSAMSAAAQTDGAPPPSGGPQGSSQQKPGEERYDRVGWASVAQPSDGMSATSNLLPSGSHAEVTALESGRTILVAIRGEGDELVDLSSAAARELGISEAAPVRVRRVTASAQDAVLLAAGQPASRRADAPPVLLAGLKRQLVPEAGRPARPMPRAVRTSSPAPVQARARVAGPTRTAGLFVQVAAVSNVQRARALADQLGGVVRSAGNVHRVQIGPYADTVSAQRARADVARRGYGDARIVKIP